MLRKIAIALAAASLLGAAAIPTDALAFGRGGGSTAASAEAASLVVLLVTALLAAALGPAFAVIASAPGSVLASDLA